MIGSLQTPMIDFLLGLVCLLAAIAPFALIYLLTRLGDPNPTGLAEGLNETWLANAFRAVFLEREPSFDTPPPRIVRRWPPLILELAASFSNGADCAFALHDALIDSGYAKLAEQFRKADYSRDCRVIRLILEDPPP